MTTSFSERVLAVSVVVPAFNCENTIERAVISLLNQDISANYEIVVVDDGSTDNTKAVVESINSSKVRFVRQENMGASGARRKGVIESRGEYVCFLDSDDIAVPCYLSSLKNALDENSSAILAYGIVADMQGKRLVSEQLPVTEENGILSDPLVALLVTGCFTASMNLMTTRTIALFASEDRAKIYASNDYDFCLRASTQGPFVFANEITILIERFESGISSRLSHLQAGFAVISCYEAYKLSERRDKEIKKALRNRIKLLWHSAFIQLIMKGEYIIALKVLKIASIYLSPSDVKFLYWAILHERKKNRGDIK